MASFLYKNKEIYYQMEGQGKPILLLNGIMMSCASWEAFVPSFTERNTLIRIDFIDQGNSARWEEAYTQDEQVEVMAALFHHLNLEKASIMGVSYGGEVGMKFAIKYPQHVDRLILANTSARTSNWLGDIGHCWNRVGDTLDGEAYYDLAIPVIYSPSYYERRAQWMSNRRKLLVPLFSTAEFQSRMKRLVNSAENHDCRKELSKIQAPTLVISSQYDFLTPQQEQEFLVANIKNSSHVIIPDCGHASMYEQPMLFTALVLGFANAAQEYKI